MRVLYLTNNPNLASTARVLQILLRRRLELNISAMVIAQKPGRFVKWLQGEELPHRIDPMPWFRRSRPWECAWSLWKISRWVQSLGGVDLIHCNEHDLYPFAEVLRHILRVPVLCYLRYTVDCEFTAWAFAGKRQPEALVWTSQTQWDDCRHAVDGVVEESRQHLCHLGVDQALLETGCSDRKAIRETWGVQENDIVVGMASAINPRKRVQDYVRLIAQLARQGLRIVGVLAGPTPAECGEYRGQVERLARSLGVADRIRWLGRLDPVGPLYVGTDVLVSTSEYETFGNSVCEAMAFGCPVVAYRGGSIAEVLGDSGIVVDTGDVDSMSREVGDLINSPERRLRLGKAARERVDRLFSGDVFAQRLLALYHQLVEVPLGRAAR